MKTNTSLQTVYEDPSFSQFGKPCDALIYTDDGTEFQVHSKLLSRHSEFFNGLFSIDEEIGQRTVIHGIDPKILEVILIYLYTKRVKLTTENMMQLLVASDFLMIESLVQKTRTFVLQNRTVKNCVGIYSTAYRIKGLGMEDQCRRFFSVCFEKAVKQSVNEASNLPYRALKYFLSSRSVNVSGERTVWSVIEAWVMNDPNNRFPMVPEVLRCLNMDQMDDELALDVVSSPIIRNNEIYKDFGDPHETLSYLSDVDKARMIMIYRNDVPHVSGVRLPRSVYLVTQQSPENDGVDMFVTYDDDLALWRKIGKISFFSAKILRIHDRVYIFKGARYFFAGAKVAFVVDINRNEVKRMAQIPSPRFDPYFVLEAAGRIFVLGVSHTVPVFKRYVDESDEWVDPWPMQAMVVEQAVSLGGMVYAIGFWFPHVIMQSYDPVMDRWKTVAPPYVRRSHTGIAGYHGKIFLVGGVYVARNGRQESLRDVEVYDPVRDEWAVYPQLPFEFGFRTTASEVMGRLFVYDYLLQSSVVYWDGSGQWTAVGEHSPLRNMHLYHFCPFEEEDVVREIMRRNKAVNPAEWVESGLDKEMLLKSFD